MARAADPAVSDDEVFDLDEPEAAAGAEEPGAAPRGAAPAVPAAAPGGGAPPGGEDAAADAPPARRPPGRPSARALLVGGAVAALAAALAATAGTAHARAQAEAARAGADLLLGVADVGSPRAGLLLSRPTSRPEPPAGTTPVRVLVPVANRGDDVVEVRPRRLTAAHQSTWRSPYRLVLPPGTTSVVGLRLAVDCPAVAAASRAADPPGADDAEEALVAAVRPDGGEATEVHLPLPPTAGSSLRGQLEEACSQAGDPDPTASFRVTDDGRLAVSVQTTGTRPSVLRLRSSRDLGVTSDPALPLVLPPAGRADVVLGLSPDCAAVGDGTGAALDLDLVDGGGPDAPSSSTDLDRGRGTTGLSAWLVRSVALACG